MLRRTAALALLLAAGTGLRAESSDYPLAINLPTSERMQHWDIGMIFTHRFVTPVKGHGKDVYGVDGYAYPALGLSFGIGWVKGLNLLIYRTADNKTFTAGLQQQVLDVDWLRLAVRADYFDEVVEQELTSLGRVGIRGGTVQLPAEFFLGDRVIVSVVPTYISNTATKGLPLQDAQGQPLAPHDSGVFNVGIGLRIDFTAALCFMGEFYPRPSHLAKAVHPETAGGTHYENGFELGFSYKTLKHRFTVNGGNVIGTTAQQVLGGDHAGGPRPPAQWSLGFNIARVF